MDVNVREGMQCRGNAAIVWVAMWVAVSTVCKAYNITAKNMSFEVEVASKLAKQRSNAMRRGIHAATTSHDVECSFSSRA